jgi:hypothetical protein
MTALKLANGMESVGHRKTAAMLVSKARAAIANVEYGELK